MRKPIEYFVDAQNADTDFLANQVYRCVMRANVDDPGFCLINLGAKVTPAGLRTSMVALKLELGLHYARQTGRRLNYLSMGRFDQQVTTKFHRDGAPDESILMLGYEPSTVRSQLFMADYSKCAHKLGLTPQEFLRIHNPMYIAGEDMLRDCITELTDFNTNHFQIAVINNSAAAFNGKTIQGVLHKAIIANPDKNARRIVNSTMIAAQDEAATETVDTHAQQHFLLSEEISKPVYP